MKWDLHPADTTGPMVSPALKDEPSKLFVELTTHCNMECRICIKKSEGAKVSRGDMSHETWAALEPVFAGLDCLVLNGAGESLLHPHLPEFIARAKERMPPESWIGFQSNGMLLTEQRAYELIEAGLDRICLSVDGILPETFSRVRQGGQVDDLEKAFAALAKAREAFPDSRFQVGIQFVVMRDNLRELPATIKWAAEQGAEFAIVSQLLPYNKSQVDQVAFDINSDAAVAIYERWKGKATEAGVQLENYLVASNQYPREDTLRVKEFINWMKVEGRSRNVTMDVLKLLRREGTFVRMVEEVFELACEVAEKTGMDLKLPATVPTEDRHCSFIEEGAAFVSWDGNVHPCNFLWHTYHCYIDGSEKPVQAKCFGNVKEGLLDIWNGKSFRRFRENVLNFDYPVCSNCSAGPCAYVCSEEFVQDCYQHSEPCGACLWAMGVLQCLQ